MPRALAPPPAAHSLGLEVGSSGPAAGGASLGEPTSHLGLQGKTTVEQGLGWEGHQPGFFKAST